LWTTYSVTDAFGLGFGAIYQGDTFINNSNTAMLPGYTRLDLAAYYDISPNWRLQFHVENLTDELYFPNAHSTHQASVGAPLNAKLTLVGTF
jgi:catecholate siderophore receptor